MSLRLKNLLLLGLLVILMIPLFVGIPQRLYHNLILATMGSRYHIVLFLVLTLLLYHHGPMKGRLTLVVVFCLFLGAATELLQSLFGRTTNLTDWLLDAQGIGFAVCWIWYRRTGRRALPLMAFGVLVALVILPLHDLPVVLREVRAAQARFPLLEDFERPHALKLWSRQPNMTRSLVAVPGRGQVLQIDNDGMKRGIGISTRRLPYDWSGYTKLQVACRLVDQSPDSLQAVVRLDSRLSPRDRDFATMTFTVGRQWQVLTIPLTELMNHHKNRTMSLQDIFVISIHVQRREPGPISLQIDSLQLVDASTNENHRIPMFEPGGDAEGQ